MPVTLLPIDQLSSGVSFVMPSPYFSATMRPFQVATNAVVSASGTENAASIAAFTLSMSMPGGIGVFGSRSPIGQSCEAAGGRLGFTAFGVKSSVVLPSGYVTQPWLPV